MIAFTFDVKLFATVHASAPDEASARVMIEDRLTGLIEGMNWGDADGSIEINSVSTDGLADLVALDGEAV